MYRQKDTGFSLLELMVVVAIIGIIAAMAVPSYQNMIERNRLKLAAEALKLDILFAHTEAIKQNQSFVVSREQGNFGVWRYGLAIRTSIKTNCDCNVAETSASNYLFSDIDRVRICTPNQPFANWQNRFTQYSIGLLITSTLQAVAT